MALLSARELSCQSVQRNQEGHASEKYEKRNQEVTVGSNRPNPYTKTQIDLHLQLSCKSRLRSLHPIFRPHHCQQKGVQQQLNTEVARVSRCRLSIRDFI